MSGASQTSTRDEANELREQLSYTSKLRPFLIRVNNVDNLGKNSNNQIHRKIREHEDLRRGAPPPTASEPFLLLLLLLLVLLLFSLRLCMLLFFLILCMLSK